MIQFYDIDLKYSYNCGLPAEDYKEIGQLLKNDIYESSNLIEKQIKNIMLQASYVNISEIRKTRDSQSLIEIFSGIVVNTVLPLVL